MVLYTGIDIEEIKRIEKSLSNPRFLDRLFGVRELGQFRACGERSSFAAGNFCAKEAFSKVLGTGLRGFALREVEVLRDELGKPYFRLSGKAAELVAQRGLRLDVSISHTESYAVASVIAYGEEAASRDGPASSERA